MPDSTLSARQRFEKRAFDIVVGGAIFALTAPLSAAAVVAATVDTRQWGVFSQRRVGRNGELFTVYKVRTMRPVEGVQTTVTTGVDARITRLGRLLRAAKIDELPQLINVLKGEMSIVGPRPDVPGFADELSGPDRVILQLRPGITGPASVAYRHEEDLLARQADPERFNREVIWPDKVRINREYLENWSLALDLRCIIETIFEVSSWRAAIPAAVGA